MLPVSGQVEIRIRDLLGREQTLYRYTTQATIGDYILNITISNDLMTLNVKATYR